MEWYMEASISHMDSWGGGGSQITILLHKPYLVYISEYYEGGEVKIAQKFDHVVYGWPL